MVFQSDALYPHEVVRQNIGFELKMMRLPKATLKSRVPTPFQLRHDRTVYVGFSPSGLRLFDAADGAALKAPQREERS